MKMTSDYREYLVRTMAQLYGYEHPITIEFAEMCESADWTTKDLETILRCHERHPERFCAE